MLDQEKCGCSQFPQYDAMSTEELRIFLDTTAYELELDETRWGELAYVIKLYGARMRAVSPPPRTARESFADFAKNYPEAIAAISAKPQQPSVNKHSHRIWRKVASVAAAVAISFTLITATAYAAGVPLWSAVIEWTRDTFRFVWEKEITPGDASLILQKYGVSPNGVPYWIPEGYELVAFDFDETDVGIRYDVGYIQENYTVIFSVSPYNKNSNHLFQQSSETEIYDSNGIRYYLFPNLKRMVAVWMEEGCECDISGEFTKEELKAILDQMNQE